MSSIRTKLGLDVARTVAIICVLALVVAGVLWWVLSGSSGKRYSAMFSGTVGLYAANDVRVLGVKVGHVDSVTPMGDQVKVDLVVDDDVNIPADAKAVIVAPSLVSDRYVQLTPAYTGGPQLASGTLIPLERTATPLEVDDLYASLDRVTDSLGPNGVNKNGALSDLLTTLAKNLQGNGDAAHATITQFGQALQTLAENSPQFFATVDNLQKFTATLAGSDAQVRQFQQQLADVTRFLSSERGDLAEVLAQLSVALGTVQKFIADNRGRIKSNVDKLASITQVLVDQRAALAETLDLAPLGLSGVTNSLNASSITLDARVQINELQQPPILMICNVLKQSSPVNVPKVLSDACGQLSGVVQGLVPLPSTAEVIAALQKGQLPPLPMPLAGMVYGTGAKGATH